jgi:anti-sigma-K factor RskA
MKPCPQNRKLIVWLSLNTLDARKAAALRDHLALCEGCRRYWEEISNVTERLAAAAPDSNLEASELFHHRVAEKLQAVESSSVLENLAAWLRGSMLNWRVALPAVAVLVIALIAMVAPRHHPAPSPPAPPAVQVVSASSSESDLAPTLANYQMVASQSLEKLSELLTRQGNKSLPPAPVYTMSSFELTNASF